jgi:hypothetical protein
MTDDVTRRAVLRRGAAATGAATAAVVGLSGTAAASLDCPRSVDEWADQYSGFHRTREQFRLDRTGHGYDTDVAWDLLDEPHYADKTVMMAQQTIAAQANIVAIRAGDGETCSDAVEATGPVMESAITWLDCTGGRCDGWVYLAAPDDYTYTLSWTDSRGVDGEPVWAALKAFNEGRHCDGCGSGEHTGSADGETAGDVTGDGGTGVGGSRPRPDPLN